MFESNELSPLDTVLGQVGLGSNGGSVRVVLPSTGCWSWLSACNTFRKVNAARLPVLSTT